jgi:cytochrome P450
MDVREADDQSAKAGGCPVTGAASPLNGESLTEPGNIAHPLAFYKRMRDQDPVYYDEKLGYWLVSRYEDIWTVFKDPITFSFKHGYFDTLGGGFFEEFKSIIERDGGGHFPDAIMEDPPLHARVRRLTEKAFTAHRVAQLEERMGEIAEDLIEQLLQRCEKGEVVDGVRGYANPFTVRVICEQLGVPQVEWQKIQRWAWAWVSQISCMQDREMMLANAKDVCDLQNYIIGEVRARQTEPREDMISDIVHATLEDGTKLTFEESVSIVRALMVGGHETTATALTNMEFLLCTRPEVVKNLREAAEDERKMTRFVEEILRIAPPSRALSRTTTAEVQLGDKLLPKGAHLLVVFESGNDDETVFPCPRDFDPDRSNLGKHVAFGGGIHRCIGAALARGEIKVTAREFAKRIGSFELAVPPESLEYLPTVATHSIKQLPMRVTRRA